MVQTEPSCFVLFRTSSSERNDKHFPVFTETVFTNTTITCMTEMEVKLLLKDHVFLFTYLTTLIESFFSYFVSQSEHSTCLVIF